MIQKPVDYEAAVCLSRVLSADHNNDRLIVIHFRVLIFVA